LTEKKTLSNWLKSRYLMIIRSEENFAVKKSYRFSLAYLIGLGFSLVLLVFLISLFVIRSIVPLVSGGNNLQSDNTLQLIELYGLVDSLSNQMELSEKYLQNIRRIFEGNEQGLEEGMILSSIPQGGTPRDNISGGLSATDSLFRKEFEEAGFGLISLGLTGEDELMDIYFFPPVNGIISAPFDIKSDHFGVDIVAKKNEPIKSIADGTVILASWTQDSGYTIAVQHRGNIISIYKHNAVLLKKVGNFVRAGEIIAIIGNSGELTDGPHLHLEIWHNGNPLDPEQVISF
jgi:murein DD-endopeptidase MepM/ murein hydrolase activator NlpD